MGGTTLAAKSCATWTRHSRIRHAILRRHHFAAAFGVGGYAAGPDDAGRWLQEFPT